MFVMKNYNQYNKQWQHLYNSQWSKESKLFLKQNPLCVYCLQVGITTPATITDHIKPHKGDMELFWDKKNRQPLCKICHDSIKAKEESRGCSIGCDINGFPVGDHPWNKE